MPQTDTANVIPELAGGWNDGLAYDFFRILRQPQDAQGSTTATVPAGRGAALAPVCQGPAPPPPVGSPGAQPTRGNSARCTLLVARPAKHLNLNWPHDRLVVVTPTASTRPARMDASLRAHGVVVTRRTIQRRNIITCDAQRPNHTAPAPPRHRRRRPGQCCQMPAKTRSVPMQGIEPPSVERMFWQKVPTELPTKSKVTTLVPTTWSTPATPGSGADS